MERIELLRETPPDPDDRALSLEAVESTLARRAAAADAELASLPRRSTAPPAPPAESGGSGGRRAGGLLPSFPSSACLSPCALPPDLSVAMLPGRGMWDGAVGERGAIGDATLPEAADPRDAWSGRGTCAGAMGDRDGTEPGDVTRGARDGGDGDFEWLPGDRTPARADERDVARESPGLGT